MERFMFYVGVAVIVIVLWLLKNQIYFYSRYYINLAPLNVFFYSKIIENGLC